LELIGDLLEQLPLVALKRRRVAFGFRQRVLERLLELVFDFTAEYENKNKRRDVRQKQQDHDDFVQNQKAFIRAANAEDADDAQQNAEAADAQECDGDRVDGREVDELVEALDRLQACQHVGPSGQRGQNHQRDTKQ